MREAAAGRRRRAQSGLHRAVEIARPSAAEPSQSAADAEAVADRRAWRPELRERRLAREADGYSESRDWYQKERLHCTFPLVVRNGAGHLGRRQKRLTSFCRQRQLRNRPLGAASHDYKIGFNLARAL